MTQRRPAQNLKCKQKRRGSAERSAATEQRSGRPAGHAPALRIDNSHRLHSREPLVRGRRNQGQAAGGQRSSGSKLQVRLVQAGSSGGPGGSRGTKSRAGKVASAAADCTSRTSVRKEGTQRGQGTVPGFKFRPRGVSAPATRAAGPD